MPTLTIAATPAAAPTRIVTPAAARTIGIFALALFLRLAVVAAAALRPPHLFFRQASELTCLAQSLLAGHGFSAPFGGATGPSAFLAPGYPLLVAFVFRFFGVDTAASATVLMLLQALFGAATVFAIMHLARRFFTETAAIAAGFFWACAPAPLFFPTIFWETALSTLLLTSIFAVAASPSKSQWPLLAALTCIALAVNPSLLIAIAALWIWAAHHTPPSQRRAPWLAATICLLLLSLWPLRNWRQMHAFIPLRTNFGYELWQGNHPGATGFFDPALHLNANAAEFRSYAASGELAYMHHKSIVAEQYILAHPARFFSLTLKRAFCFWTGVGVHPSWPVIFYTTTISLLGLFGLLLLAHRTPRTALLFALPLILFPLPYYLTHPDFRFRMVLDPLLILLAVDALQRLQLHRPQSTPRPRQIR